MSTDTFPPDWSLVRLGDIANVVKEQLTPDNKPEEKFNYLSIGNIESNTGNLVNFAPTFGEEIRSAKLVFTTKDILYSKLRPYLNKVHLPNFDGISATDLIPIRPREGIPREYIAYFLRTRAVVEYANQRMRGIQLPRLPVADLLSLPIPLPPLAEQERIVVKIEELFQELRIGRQALQKVPPLINRFRQSVLYMAFRGRLVPQNPNDEPAEKLLQTVREKRRKEWEEEVSIKGKDQGKYKYKESESVNTKGLTELPEGWAWTKLDDAVRINPHDGDFGELSPDLPVTFIPMGAIDAASGSIVSPEVMSLEKARKGHTQFKNGDVLFARITPCMENGKAAVAKNLQNDLGFGSTEFHVLRSDGAVLPEYIFYFVRQESFRNYVADHMTSTVGQLRVPTNVMRNVDFPIPPLAEQEHIVTRIQELFNYADQVENAVEVAINRADKSDQAILVKAFRGELVPQDPDDEPASVLLDRIRAQRSDTREGKHFSQSRLENVHRGK